MALSPRQQSALKRIAREPQTAVGVAMALDTTVRGAQKVIDALLRRNLATVNEAGRYVATDRGMKRVSS